MTIEGGITSLVTILIFILLATAFAFTVSEESDTRSCDSTIGDNVTGCELENISGTAKVVYGTFDILWAVLIILGVVGAFGLAKKFRF